ncbi:hypothetical protein HU200_057640 [Digitaria exilis]|uniref:Uncharacterized protein n=1 Tax=Digitaria exilis TaxID=1010633 RepID=A0A835DZT4_9POAL|nr:hypothetical protein HU200_057640 [Digitaria exilis]
MLVFFEGAAPNIQRVIQAFKDESYLWWFAGAKRLADLYPSVVAALTQ